MSSELRGELQGKTNRINDLVHHSYTMARVVSEDLERAQKLLENETLTKENIRDVKLWIRNAKDSAEYLKGYVK